MIKTTEVINRQSNHCASVAKPGEDKFILLLQGPGSNKLSQISTRSNISVDPITGVATVTDGDFKAFIDKYRTIEKGFKISTHKLLDICILVLSRQNHYRGTGGLKTLVSIPLEEYMNLCDIKDTKSSRDKARRRVQRDLDILYNTSIEWKEKNRTNTRDYAKMRLITSQSIKAGNILVGFSPEFASYLNNAYLMQYHTALLTVDERNPNIYRLGRKILLHHSINKNQFMGTANLISVQSLLDACPDIPNYDEVMGKDRHLHQRIIKPFTKSLDALPFITWEYSEAKGIPVTDDTLEYGKFITRYIKFNISGAQTQMIRIYKKPRLRKKIKTK